ncbi:MAG TPA: CHC2 zinc finger domain-containing protein [Puia sp.]|nr:CHC2 zinc finger domain-containing protein [Puia sp.]
MDLNQAKKLPTCAELNNLDIVDYLASIGHFPRKIKGHNYWYLSPLRTEKTPSFKVNRNLNRWKDFGTGEGSSLVDFGIRYFNCTIKELLITLSGPFS